MWMPIKRAPSTTRLNTFRGSFGRGPAIHRSEGEKGVAEAHVLLHIGDHEPLHQEIAFEHLAFDQAPLLRVDPVSLPDRAGWLEREKELRRLVRVRSYRALGSRLGGAGVQSLQEIGAGG